MGLRFRATFGALLTLVFLLAAHLARAQDEGGGDGGGDAGGDIFGEAFSEPPEPDEAEGPEHEAEEGHPDNVIWTLGAGGQLSYGNARTAAFNATTNLSIRRGDDVAVIEGSLLYAVAQAPLSCGSVQAEPANFTPATQAYCGPAGVAGSMSTRARAPGFNDWAETIVNLNWRLRYDHFTDPYNAFFLGHRGRIDRFAGVQPRLGLQLGYSRLLLEERQHTFALDLGVDGTFDIYTDTIRFQTGAIVASGGTLPVLSGTDARFVPSVRVALAYANHLNAFLTYDTTLEALWDVANPSHFRFEWINHLRSAIDETFSIILDVTFRLDSLPPGQARVWVEDPSIQTTTMFEVNSTLKLQGIMDLDGTPHPSSTVGEDAPEEEEAEEEAEEAHQEIEEDEEESRDLDSTPAIRPEETAPPAPAVPQTSAPPG